MNNTDQEQLINIEIKLAHQEKLVEELNSALYLQQKRMDQLEKSLEDLKKIIQSGDQEIRPNEKPPHY